MRKKTLVGGLCAIVAASFLYFKAKDNIFYDNTILPQPAVFAKIDNNYQSYLAEFSKRIISISESDNFRCEITNSGKGGSAYNSQSSKSFKNSIFYIGDDFSSIISEIKDDGPQP